MLSQQKQVVDQVKEYKNWHKLRDWALILKTDDTDDMDLLETVYCFIENDKEHNTDCFFRHQEAILLGCLLSLVKTESSEKQTCIGRVADLLLLDKEQIESRFKEACQTGKINSTFYEYWQIVSSSMIFEHTVIGLWTKINK